MWCLGVVIDLLERYVSDYIGKCAGHIEELLDLFWLIKLPLCSRVKGTYQTYAVYLHAL